MKKPGSGSGRYCAVLLRSLRACLIVAIGAASFGAHAQGAEGTDVYKEAQALDSRLSVFDPNGYYPAYAKVYYDGDYDYQWFDSSHPYADEREKKKFPDVTQNKAWIANSSAFGNNLNVFLRFMRSRTTLAIKFQSDCVEMGKSKRWVGSVGGQQISLDAEHRDECDRYVKRLAGTDVTDPEPFSAKSSVKYLNQAFDVSRSFPTYSGKLGVDWEKAKKTIKSFGSTCDNASAEIVSRPDSRETVVKRIKSNPGKCTDLAGWLKLFDNEKKKKHGPCDDEPPESRKQCLWDLENPPAPPEPEQKLPKYEDQYHKTEELPLMQFGDCAQLTGPNRTDFATNHPDEYQALVERCSGPGG